MNQEIIILWKDEQLTTSAQKELQTQEWIEFERNEDDPQSSMIQYAGSEIQINKGNHTKNWTKNWWEPLLLKNIRW